MKILVERQHQALMFYWIANYMRKISDSFLKAYKKQLLPETQD